MSLSQPAGAFLALLVALGLAGRVNAQAGRPHSLSDGDVFPPLLADPKQPHFFAAWLWIDSPLLRGSVASVGLGEEIGLLRGREGRWQVSLAAGAFSQFDLDTPSNDLINTDFVVGFPIAFRRGPLGARVRAYHQSSHLGDEFILSTNPERVNLSFEAAELLVSGDLGRVRVYSGGEYIYRHEPSTLKPGLVHGGLEYRGSGSPRIVLGLDAKWAQERGWDAALAARAGVEVVSTEANGFRTFSVQLQAYRGPAPYGQFYQSAVRSIGAGVHFAL